MSTQFQLRRGNTSQTSTFTGAEGEVTVNTTNKSVVVHDGITQGGFEVARVDLINIDNETFAAKANAAGVSGGGGGALTASISSVNQSNPGVVTTTADHEFSDGQQVTFTDVGGMTELNGNSYFCDVLTGNTFALYSDPGLTTPLNTTGFFAYTSGGNVVATTAPGAPTTASYIVIGANPVLQNERVLTPGAGIVLQDGGAGGGATLSANLASTVPSNLGSAAAGIANTVSRSDHVHAMPTAMDVGAVPSTRTVIAGNGLSGGGELSSNVTLNLSAGLANLTDIAVSSLVNGDVLVYNNATSKWENTQNLPRMTLQSQTSNVGTQNAVRTLSFSGNAVSSGQVSVIADTDPTRVIVSIPEIFTQERVEDIAGSMITGSTQNGISVTYDDPAGKINFQTNNFDINLTGDVQGTATVTNLGNVSISTTIAANSVTLGTDTTGNYVQQVSVSGSGISATPSTAGEGSNIAISLASGTNNVGNTLVFRDSNGSFAANVITATLNGSASQNVLKTGDTMTGALILSANPTANLQAATKAYVDSTVASASFLLNTTAGTGSGTLINGDTLGISGGTGITTSLTGDTFTITNNGVTSISAGSGISVSAATGAITISATGVVAGVSSINSQSGAITLQGTSGKIEVTQPSSGVIRISTPDAATFSSITASSMVSSSVTATGNVTGANINATTSLFAPLISKTGSNGVGNIGSAANYFNTVFAKATSAQYADLAELYLADDDYEPGTVVAIGGTAEVTVCEQDADTAVVGVVSTDPAYLMNTGMNGDHPCQVALVGRVPCKVTGLIKRGSLLVSAGDGTARAEKSPAPGTIIGKALQDFNGESGVIEVLVGRF